MVSASGRYLFYQPVDEKMKTWNLRFPAKGNPNMEKALFDWPIVLQYDVKAKYRLISRKFSGMKFFHPSVRLTNQKPRAFVFGSLNQSNGSISVRLLFLFCSRVLISRSYENRCNRNIINGSAKCSTTVTDKLLSVAWLINGCIVVTSPWFEN